MKNCILGDDYDEECENVNCPNVQLCRRLNRKNERNQYVL